MDQSLLCCFHLILHLWGIPSRHSQSFCEELVCKWWGSCAWTKCPLVPSPHPKIHHRNYMDGIPIHARNCSCLTDWRCFKQSAFTLYFPKSIVQTYHKVLTSMEPVPYIWGTRSGVILLKCKILVPPWELVPHCMCTSPKWSKFCPDQPETYYSLCPCWQIFMTLL